MNDEGKRRIRAAARARRRARLEQPPAHSRPDERASKEEARGLLDAWLALIEHYGPARPILPALFLPTASEPDIRLILDSGPCIVPALVDPSGAPLTEPDWMPHPDEGARDPSLPHSQESAPEGARRGPRSLPSRLLGPEALAKADIIAVPALSVDARGTRIGQGGGWYDRALLHAPPSTPRVGVLFDEDFASSPLPRMPHDQRMNAILTPSGYRILDALD